MRGNQVFTFEDGLNTDIHASRIGSSQYRSAVNMYMTENSGRLAMSNLPEITKVGSNLDADLNGFHIMFQANCTATFGTAKTEEPAVIGWFQNQVGQCRIVIMNARTKVFNMIYDDTQSAVRDRLEPLNLSREIDAYHFSEGKDHWVYWIDGMNPLRKILAHVEEPNVWDNSIAPYSQLFVPNEPDLLYVQRLWPVDMPTITDVLETGGGLATGKYSFAYRYFNSETNTYSAMSMICLGVNVTASRPSTENSNSLSGGGINTTTSKSIEITIDKGHFHHTYYDSIQLVVIKKSGSDVATLSLLSPSQSYYGSQNTPSVIKYTGNEATSVISENEVTLQDAAIQTSTTVEVSENRLFLASAKYWDLSVPNVITFNASTHIEEIPIEPDPMVASDIDGYGYYDEMNELRKGYYRSEVYPFSLIWMNKFGHFSFPYRIQFPQAGRYNPSDHANTWDFNWSDSSGFDWKFPSRNSSQGSLFAEPIDSIRIMGLSLQNVIGHPDWAYGVAVLRGERKKNILGQTPIIHAMGCQGVGRFESEVAADEIGNSGNTDKASPFWIRKGLYEYDGSLDTFLPKIMAHGHTKHFVARQIFVTGIGQNDDRGVWHLVERLAYAPVLGSNTVDNPKNTLVYLYPLEYLANQDGEGSLSLSGNERLNIIDLVALEPFSNIISADDSLLPPVSSYGFGKLPRYSLIYSPRLAESYYYHNNGVGTLQADVPCFANNLRIQDIYQQVLGGGKIVTSEAYSNRVGMNHIRIIDGLDDLVQQQTENPDSVWKGFQILSPGVTINQRGLIVSLEHDDTQIADFVYDPVARIYEDYINSPSPGVSFSDLFGNSTPIDPDAIWESDITDFANTTAAQVEPPSRFAPWPSTVPVFIANIEVGLGDDRYGSTNESLSYLFTGAYLPIGTTELENPSGLDFTVFGGDCYITRLIAQLRNNAPIREMAEIIDSANHSHLIDSTQTGVSQVINKAFRCSSHTFMFEVIDLWVESEINGHYIHRSNVAYPKGIEERDTGTQVDPNNPPGSLPDFTYPSQSALQMMSASQSYLYNIAYSSENNTKVFTFPGDSFRVLLDVGARVHYSNPKIINSNVDGFDVFSSGDFFDLDGTFGKIWKLLRGANKRLYAFQENAIAQLLLGKTLTEDIDGFLLASQSGQAIGYAYYVSDNQESGGEFGIQGVQSAVDVEGGIMGFDFRRKSVFLVSGDTAKSISYLQVEDLIEQEFIDPNASSYYCWYDPKRKRSGVGMRGENAWASINFYNGIGKWESIWKGTSQIVHGFVPAGNDLFVFAAKAGSFSQSEFQIGTMFTNLSVRDTFLGLDSASELQVVMNKEFGVDNVLSCVVIVSNRPPTSLEAQAGTGDDVSLVDQVTTSVFNERQRAFHATQLVTSGEKRLRDSVIPIKILSSGDSSPLIVESIKALFRSAHRHVDR